MATLPTPEEIARKILSILVHHFQLWSGAVLRMGNFLAVWDTTGLQANDFKPGMEYAAQRGWVEVLDGGSSFRLTDVGFGEA